MILPKLATLRAILWPFVLVASSTLLLLPVKVVITSYPIESVTSLGTLFVPFSLIFVSLLATCAWISMSRRSGDVERVLALALFASVFGGFWFVSQHAMIGETFNYATDVKVAGQTGYLPYPLNYPGWPGIALLVSSLSKLSGIATFQSIVFMSQLGTIMFSIVSFLLLRRFLENSQLASVGVLLLIVGDISVGDRVGTFSAEPFSDLVLFPMMLLLVARLGRRNSFLLLLLTLDLVITHLVTIVVVTIFWVLMILLQRKPSHGTINLRLIAVSVFSITLWQGFGNGTNFGTFVQLGRNLLEFPQIFARLLQPTLLASSYNPLNIPLWASFSIYFWLSVMGLTFIITLWEVYHRRASSLFFAGIVSSIVFSIVALVTSGLGDAIFRPLLYIGFFVIPGFLLRVRRSRVNDRLIQVLAVALLVPLVLPTFLAYNLTIASAGYTAQDLQLGSYLAHFPQQDFQIYGVTNTWPYLQYYVSPAVSVLPMAFTFVPWTQMPKSDVPSLYQSEMSVIAQFRSSSFPETILVYSMYQWSAPFKVFFGLNETALPPVNLGISDTFPRIYDEGTVSVYAR